MPPYIGFLVLEKMPSLIKYVDFSIASYDYLRGLGKHLENLGDMNGDGCDELGYRSYYHDNDTYIGYTYANILLGSTVCDTITDYIYEFSSDDGYGIEHTPELKWLGDINGDGFDDVGFVISHRDNPNEDVDWVHIIYGNEFEYHYFDTFEFTWSWTELNGVGDVNNDGFDDFIIGHNGNEFTTKLLYYGNSTISHNPDTIITDLINDTYFDITGGVAIGDWNGDGIDDFNGGIDSSGPDIWLGSETQYLAQNMHLDFNDWLVNRNGDYGDLNGDGKDDFVAGNSGGFTGANGNVYAYIGGQNGTCDIEFEGEYGVALGWSVSVGDFNGDGFDDIAAGGNGHGAMGDEDCWCGKVYVYAGNADLEEADPDVEITEEIIPKPEIEFNAYPNPFNPTINFEIKFNNQQIKQNKQFQLEIYNAKGQKLETIPLSSDSIQVKSILWNAENYSSGIYLCKLVNGLETVSRKKVTLLK